MAKPNNTGRNTKGQYVLLPFSMIESPAFQALPPAAIALYVHVAHRYNGSNNGSISFSVGEAAVLLRAGKATATRLFNELVEKGFLKVSQQSSFSFKTKTARRWELTQWPLRHGVAPSNDWRFWKPKNLEHGFTTDTDGSTTEPLRHPETVYNP